MAPAIVSATPQASRPAPTTHRPSPSCSVIVTDALINGLCPSDRISFVAFIAENRKVAAHWDEGAVGGIFQRGTRTLCISVSPPLSLTVSLWQLAGVAFHTHFSLILVLCSSAFVLLKCHLVAVAAVAAAATPAAVFAFWSKTMAKCWHYYYYYYGYHYQTRFLFRRTKRKDNGRKTSDQIKRCHSCSWLIFS